ncbi:hypothetical protein [Natronospora cellulosivora (SeqCode)]
MINIANKMRIYGQGEGSLTLLFTCGGGFGFALGNFYNSFTGKYDFLTLV